MTYFVRALLSVVCATLAITIISCGGGSTTTPVVNITGDTTPAVEVATTWPAGLPADAAQPWETLDSDGKVSACLNADSEFLAGCEHFYDCTTGITDVDETVHIESGEPGSGLIAWAMYRVVMGGEQPGVVTADVNPGVTGDGAVSEYYVGLSDYSGGQWDWHGPFTDNHVRISTGADVTAGGDYLSEIGNHFACIVAYDGAVVDVVGVATNSYDETDTEAPPVPTSLHAFPAYGALDVYWDDVLAGDLAGYRLYWSEADFATTDEAGVHSMDYLIGQGSYLLTNLPAATIRVRVSAVDISGNESALSDMTSVLVYEGAGPELRLGVSAAGGLINDAITLTATGATNYAWDLDGDGTYEITGDTTGVQTADTGHTGVIRPSVRGTTNDESCVACGAVSLVIASNSRPVASALADPAMGLAPLLTTLTGNGLDIDGTIASYSWDFDGDGTYDQTDATDPGPVEHTYTDAGMYNAKFRVEDDLGAWDVDTVSIFVSEPVVVNNPPVADLAIGTGEESGDAPHSVHFDASGSTDPDGAEDIVEYHWDLDGDGMYEGTTDTAGFNYTYQSPGVYTAKVKVEDADGDCSTDTAEITVSVVGNDDPVADLTSNVSSGDVPLDVHFDATGSTDSDGTIVLYEWDWERDGIYDGYGTVPAANHTYTAAGTYNCRVRVSDDAGAQDTASVEISVNVPGNDYPVADLTSDVTSGDIPLTVSFDASGSTDSDGSITRYEWDFDNDGNYDGYGIDPTIDHTYTAAGVYICRMRVTDDDGAQDTDTVEITASVPGNDDPVADLTASPSGGGVPLLVTFDASGSTDSDGTIVRYEWDFDGDGTYDSYGSASGAEHTYTTGGRRTAVVRVTDDAGAQDTDTFQVDVDWDWVIITVDYEGYTGEYPSLLVVEGRPAISYFDTTSTSLNYVRAEDALGLTWGDPVVVDGSGLGENSSMAIVNNRPAITYGYSNLYYVRAGDKLGSTWGSPVTISSENPEGTSLAVVDGNPAVFFVWDEESSNEVDDDVYYCYARADDSNGTTWGAATTLHSFMENTDDANRSKLSLHVVNGNPAIAYGLEGGGVYFRRATDATGTSWGSRYEITSTCDSNTAAMAIVDGCPAVLYEEYDVIFKRATNAYGSSWGADRVISSENINYGDLAVINGKPVALWEKHGSGQPLRVGRAIDCTGGNWANNDTVDEMDTYSQQSLVEVEGRIAIAYYDAGSRDLKYAICMH